MKEKKMDKYSETLEFAKIKYPAALWIILSAIVSAGIAFASFVISTLFITEATIIPYAFGFAVIILMIGYPYLKKQAIISSIESNFSDALKQMADTLKAGDTYESALREVANSDYGRLSEEMNFALRRLEEGENLESTLKNFSDRIDSRLVKRTMVIILDSIRTGASLSDLLDDIADDVREIHKINEERKSNTTMQFIFMIAAGGVIAPMIFGEVNAVMTVFSRITLNAISQAEVNIANQTSSFVFILIQTYILVEVTATGIMMAIIREGRINKSIIYVPTLILIAFVAYYTSTIVIKLILAGGF